jgi:tripartite-type tricarboxylate transporter receptor subunit TctC
MKRPRRQLVQLAGTVVAVMLVALSGHAASSQTTRTIKIVVPAAPGGGTDILARLLAEQIRRTQGSTMVVENRPGAGGVIGTEAASRAAPDGNTLLISPPAMVVTPHLRKVNYDPLTSFEPICYLVSFPGVIVVNSASPYRALAELLNVARTKPGHLTMASFGPATGAHIAVEMLKRAANVNITYVPYAGEAPAVNALLGEHVTSGLVTFAIVAEQLKADKLRALATASLTRIEPLPDVPTIAEAGYKDFDVANWVGLFAPAKTPKEAVSELAGWFIAAMQVPEVKANLAIQGLYPVGICGADFAAFLRKQYDDYGRYIRDANIKAE